MEPMQQAEPAVVHRTRPGVVAQSGGAAVGAASFTEFIAAQVEALPAEERGPALAWLAGFGSALAARQRGAKS